MERKEQMRITSQLVPQFCKSTPVLNNKKQKNNADSVSFGLNYKTAQDIATLEPWKKLVVMAHPDDEFLFGFIAKFAREFKNSVQLMYITPGQGGRDVSGEFMRGDPRIGEKRKKELLEALETLGVDRDPIMLDLQDTQLNKSEPQNLIGLALNAVFRQIKKADPNEHRGVYSYNMDAKTNHTDHYELYQDVGGAFANFFKWQPFNVSHFEVGTSAKQADAINKNFRGIDENGAVKRIRPFAGPSFLSSETIRKEDLQRIPIIEDISKMVESLGKHKTQFDEKELPALKQFFEDYPYVDVKQCWDGSNYKRYVNNVGCKDSAQSPKEIEYFVKEYEKYMDKLMHDKVV